MYQEKEAGYSVVAELRTGGLDLSVCRIKFHQEQGRAKKKGQDPRVVEKVKAIAQGRAEKCARKGFRSRRQAMASLVDMFSGLDQTSDDALAGYSLGDLITCCGVCKSWHLLSVEELTREEAAFAA